MNRSVMRWPCFNDEALIRAFKINIPFKHSLFSSSLLLKKQTTERKSLTPSYIDFICGEMHLCRVLLTVQSRPCRLDTPILITLQRQRECRSWLTATTVLVGNVFSFTESVCVCHHGKMWSSRNLL